MVAKLQPLGQLPNGDTIATGKSFDGQQRLMLLRGDARLLSRCFAEPQKLP